jgi:hypothetical protein
MQAGLALWLVGTWLRVQLGRSRAAQEATR